MSESPKEEKKYGRETVKPSVYMDSTQRAQENRSSAWALSIVGCVGLLAVVLGLTGILPLQVGNPYMLYGVMSAVFLLFLVMGVVSMKNARIFDKRAQSENSLRDAIWSWCQDNLRAEDIDAGIAADETEPDNAFSEEEIYLRRAERVAERINHQFMNLDQTFVEHFIDESLYDEIFGQRSQERKAE